MITKVETIVEKIGRSDDKLLEILIAVQDTSEFNYLSQASLRAVSQALDISLTRVYGTAEFYSMLSTKKRGKHVIQVCNSAPCHLQNGKEVIRIFQEILGIHMGEITEDGLFSLETVSCIGACDQAPAVRIDKEVYGNLTRSKIFNILADLKRGETHD